MNSAREFADHARRVERLLCIARIGRWNGLSKSGQDIAIDALTGRFDRRLKSGRKWKTAPAPYLRDLLDNPSDSATFAKASAIGKSQEPGLMRTTAYTMDPAKPTSCTSCRTSGRSAWRR